MAAAPIIRRVFAMFDPTIFPRARSVCPLRAERILTNNSGAEVPKATTVRPITSGGIPKVFAIEEAPPTKIFAPLISKINPIQIYK